MHKVLPMAEDLLKSDSQLPSTWRSWLLLLLIAPVLLLAVTAVAVLLILAKSGGNASVIPRDLSTWFPYIAMVNHTLLFLIVVWFARSDGISLRQLGWKQERESWRLEVVIGLLAGLAIFLVQTRIAEPTVSAIRNSLQVSTLRPVSTPVLTLNIAGLIAGTLFAGIVEETVYRGYIQRQLTARLGTVAGILVTTLGFAIGLHWGLGPWSIVVVLLTGLLLALLFEWRRNLLTCALAHAVINALVVVL